MKYIVICISTGYEYTVEAKTTQQAKRIVCRWKNISPSDYWCGVTNYTARKVKGDLSYDKNRIKSTIQ